MRREEVTEVPELLEVRRLVMEDALNRTFQGGRLSLARGESSQSFPVLRRELMYASLAAWEFADAEGPFGGDARLMDVSMKALGECSERFGRMGRVSGGGDPSPYFTLVPFTRALLSLRPHVDSSRHGGLVDRGVQLFADAAARISRTHDYLNARALETVSCLGLHRLTDDRQYLDRCVECLDNLVSRQYPCGAQPYHTGLWVWGRKPAQVYQFLSGSMMLYVGRELGRDDAVEYVRRLMDYSLLATNRRGEAFVTPFEGLHKGRSLACAGRQWVLATAFGDERFRGLSSTVYEIWARGILDAVVAPKADSPSGRMGGFSPEALVEALHMGIRHAPRAGSFVPAPGCCALKDISTVFVHEQALDVAMTVLTGYSAFAEADCGNVKLFALTPELTAEPTYRNAGTDALRADWRVPSEQIECSEQNGKTVLRGCVYTKWATSGEKDFSRLHNRRLAVTMTYSGGEMVLEYETTWNSQPQPMPSRLLFLLISRPGSASPRLQIGENQDTRTPPAESQEEFFLKSAVGVVRFSSPDGSQIEIVPEISAAECVTAERPPHAAVSDEKQDGTARRNLFHTKPANEGSLRVAFDGPNALDRGRYRIRFRPAQRA